MIKRYSIVLILFLSACATPQGPQLNTETVSDTQRIENAISAAQEGRFALRNGDLKEAQLQYALAVEQDPANIDYQYQLGRVHYSQNSLTVAEGLLNRVINQQKTHTGALETLGNIYIRQSRLDEGERVLLQALEGSPSSVDILNSLGVINDLKAQHDEAKDYFAAALAIDASSAKIYNNLGYSHYLTSSFEKAETAFRRALALDTGYEKAWTNLGLILSRTGRIDAARVAFGRVQSNHEAANNIGYIALLDGDEDLARREFTRAVNSSPSYYSIAADNLQSLDGEVRTQKTIDQSTSVLRDSKPISLTILDTREDGTDGSNNQFTAKSLPIAQQSDIKKYSILFVQTALAFLGYEIDSFDGVIGNQTRTSLADFQKVHELESTGETNSETYEKLKEEALFKTQLSLSQLGYDLGVVDGFYGSKTRSALRNFQRKEGITSDGKIGSEVFQKLMERTRDSARKLNSPDMLDLSARG